MESVISIIALLLLVGITNIEAQSNVFDVNRFGAIADGKTDNSQAFLRAWSEGCEASGSSVVMVPKGTYLVGEVVFEGPCKASALLFDLRGVIKAPAGGKHSLGKEYWLTFQNVNALTLSGGGSFDGQGASAWPFSDCSDNSNCNSLPASVRFNSVRDSNVKNIESVNSKKFHFKVYKCDNMRFEQLSVKAPSDSPNTDGIHISHSTNISVADSTIGTGDDCISVGPGAKSLRVSNVFCGPGHGISIGSLGKSENEEAVSGLDIRNCTLSGTTNGLRIKTWASSKHSLANDITFDDIVIAGSDNPIIINQHYCPTDDCHKGSSSGVEIRDVRFRNIRGYSSTQVAVNIDCSKSVPCNNIELTDINIVYGKRGRPSTSNCAYVKGVIYGLQRPPACSQGKNYDMQIGDSCPR